MPRGRSVIWPALAGIIALAAIAGIAAAAGPDPPQAAAQVAVATPAGDARNAFLQPIDRLPFEQRLDFTVGQAVFERLWVAAPASTRSADGLGPLYSARSCNGCHLRNGRGAPTSAASLVTKFGMPAETAAAAIEPTYGAQLQSLGIPGQTVEGRLQIDYDPVAVVLGDGERIELRRPRYRLTDLGFGPLHPEATLSPRLAAPIIGTGLLARISEDDILAAADPDDADGDGISGRPNHVSSAADSGPALGRFGWKATEPTLMQQAARALALDIGISSPLLPDGHGDCTPVQTACRQAPTGNTPQFGNVEAPEAVMAALLFYLENLAPPPRRDTDDPGVRNGERLFASTGCAACHRPQFVTTFDPAQPWLSRREIHPYADLLLHDMGDGLADRHPEGVADGREWRTPPLWGIGRTEAVNGHAFFLHDGRARSLMEAILWHGGEADGARLRFTGLTSGERQDLLRFLESL